MIWGAGSEPVEVLAPGSTLDPYSGVDVEDWSTPTVLETLLALVEPVSSIEPGNLDRQAVITGYRLYFDGEPSIGRLSRLRVRGQVRRVSGEPAVWRAPVTGRARTVVEVSLTNA